MSLGKRLLKIVKPFLKPMINSEMEETGLAIEELIKPASETIGLILVNKRRRSESNLTK